MSARVRYALLLAVAAVPLVDVGEIKPGPRTLAALVFVVHALLSVVTRGRERFGPRDLLTATLWCACFVVSGMFCLTLLALRLWPPVTPDGHRVMAIGQALVGIVVGGGLGATVAVLGSLRSRHRDRRRERLVLHAFGALLIVAIVIDQADVAPRSTSRISLSSRAVTDTERSAVMPRSRSHGEAGPHQPRRPDEVRSRVRNSGARQARALVAPGRSLGCASRSRIAEAATRAHGDLTMGDKSPKSMRRQADQKQHKTNDDTRRKQAVITAKQVPLKKK